MNDFEILYEDNHLIAINKQPGVLVQGDKTGDEPLLEIVRNYIKEKYKKPGNVFLGLPHRLDRPTSGVILFAKTSKSLQRLNESFKSREIKKTYWAVTGDIPDPPSGKLIHYLVKNQQKNKSQAFKKEIKGSSKAELIYQTLRESDRYFLIEILPTTGRHHQIRSQLASINCPIKGDLKYGSKRSNKDGSIHLHARKLEFMHPVKKEPLIIIADPPRDPVWDALRS